MKKEYHHLLQMRKEPSMSSVSQVAQVLNVEVYQLARETGFIERERKFDGADFAHSLIFGWLQEPQISLDGLIQVLGRREVDLTSSGLSQRFTQASATFFHRLLERLSAMQMQAEEAVDGALLRRFGAVIVEDSSSVQLPTELTTTTWRGGRGKAGTSEATIKLFVRWDVLNQNEFRTVGVLIQFGPACATMPEVRGVRKDPSSVHPWKRPRSICRPMFFSARWGILRRAYLC
jgi:hypothetical protein